MLTIHELVEEFDRLSRQLDQDQVALITVSSDWAYKENEYRKSKANAFLASEGTVDACKAHVDKVCEKERYECHLAEGLKVAALEKVRSTRAQLSALQTVASSLRSEMDMAGYS